jgi:hypothetical protein
MLRLSPELKTIKKAAWFSKRPGSCLRLSATVRLSPGATLLGRAGLGLIGRLLVLFHENDYT